MIFPLAADLAQFLKLLDAFIAAISFRFKVKVKSTYFLVRDADEYDILGFSLATMIQSYGRGIGGVKLAWLHYNLFHVASSSSCGLRFGGSSRRQGVAVIRRVCELEVLGRARLSGFCHTSFRVSQNSLALQEVGATRRKGYAIKVNGSVLDPTGLDSEGNGEEKSDTESTVGAAVLGIQAENGFHGLNGTVDEEEVQEDFLSRELILNSQEAVLFNRQKNKMEIEDDDSEPLTVWPQAPGEPERWWRIPDFIHEVLPLPKNFNPQLEIIYDKLGCRIHSRELLLRILVHKSYYLSKMPLSLKERKLRKPLMSWQRLETMSDDNLMTFADAHGEARLQLALLGDTVLNLAASVYLIRQHPLLSTGLITERRSQLVCNSNLARVWSTLLDLRELVLCDPPLSQSKKSSATTVLELQMKACADTLEAYVGGLYVEKGLESALQCVETRLLPLLLLAEPIRNPVALLHERCVIVLQEKPDYKLIGIDNKNTPNESCRIRVYVKGFRLSTGIGKSQKLARRDAAEKALIKWPEVFGSTP